MSHQDKIQMQPTTNKLSKKMRKIIYLTLLNSMLFASCKGQNEQLDCFNTSLKNDELKSILIELTTG
jgi:hypothetical protein